MHNKDGTLKTVWSFQMLFESWWNTVLFSQTVLCVINVSTIEYATSAYSWHEWHDNNRHWNKLWRAHLEKEVNEKQHVLAISTEGKVTSTSAISGKVEASSKFVPLIMKQLQSHFCCKRIFLYFTMPEVCKYLLK